MLSFQKYIETLNVIILPVLIRQNSDITMEAAHDKCVESVDRVADENQDHHVYLKLTDLRDGNEYAIFSSRMMDAYDIDDQVNLCLDMVSIDRAIQQSSPDSIRKIVSQMLQSVAAPTAEDVAEELKANPDFMDSLNSSIGVFRSQHIRLKVVRKKVVLNPIRRKIRLKVVKHEHV